MLKKKNSFTLIELAMYIVVVGVLMIIMVGTQSIIENAKVIRLIEELEYYEKANANFIIRYNALPGLLSEGKCLYYNDFSGYCRNQDDINLTTSEHIYTNNNCDPQLGCTLEANGTSGSEDVLRNFLLPMRYLKTAGEIDTMEFGIEKELTENEDYSKKTWALSKHDSNVYVNIYNYYNRDSDTTLPFLFNNHNILGHTINSGRSYDHYEKLLNRQKQYLVYHKFSSAPRGAISTRIAFKLDKKFDDGMPLTGRITTYATSDFSSFANSEYAQCIDNEPVDYASTKNINYVQRNNFNGGYCNILYQLKDLSDNVNDEKVDGEVKQTATPVGGVYYRGRQKCQDYSDGSSMCIAQKGSCSQNDENAIFCCSYEDGTENCDNTTQNSVINGKLFTRYFNGFGVSDDGSYLIDEEGNEYLLTSGSGKKTPRPNLYPKNFYYNDTNGNTIKAAVVCDTVTGYIKVEGIVTNIRKFSIGEEYVCCCDYKRNGVWYTSQVEECPGENTCN